jgi:hypothetical protein
MFGYFLDFGNDSHGLFKCYPGPLAYHTCLASRRCKYGGDDEYHVDVRETGSHQQEEANEESFVEKTQETSNYICPSICQVANFSSICFGQNR